MTKTKYCTYMLTHLALLKNKNKVLHLIE
uniref:Uncharacterized protein n=1 Tax=Rhizophora mucronata TaxID=61149 RepID=A0A2P2MWR7_RHIMU